MPETPAVDEEKRVPPEAVAFAIAPKGRWAYRGKAGCQNVFCTRDSRHPERCYGWHCGHCDGPSNCQGDCTCDVPAHSPKAPHPEEERDG